MPTAKKAAPRKTTSKTAARKPTAKRPPPKGMVEVKNFEGETQRQPEAIAFLMQQHREVEKVFKAFQRAKDDEEKQTLANQICLALKVHIQIEEEILYPPAHEAVKDEDKVDEAYVEHEGAKRLIEDIERMSPGDHFYDAKVQVLCEYIAHHVEEEETELFPECKKAKLDLVGMGAQLKARSEALEAELKDDHPVHGSGAMTSRGAAPYLA